MLHKSFLTGLFLLTGLFGLQANEKPNIVLYVADDFGLASINALGADEKFVQTPNLNKLTENGIKFTNAFTTASVCSPTRYTMLTGQYSWKTRLKKGVVNNNDPLIISTETITMGKMLQSQGYRTAAVGKWHLGYTDKKFDNLLGKIYPGPNDVGFDYHFGVPNNLDDLHKVYIENDRIYGLRSDKIEAWGASFYGGQSYKGYDAPQRVCEEVMDYTTQKALDWIKKDKSKPFFMYYAAAAVHHPITPSKRMKGKSGSGLYGDFIQDLDYSVGQFIQALEQEGLMENTLFIFTSDNGGDIPASNKDWPEYQAYDMGFHYNGKTRGDKHQIYEGGLKVPFIIHWPKKVKKGQESDHLVTTADFFSTFSEIITGQLPQAPQIAPDSFSFAHLLIGSPESEVRPSLVHRDALGRQAFRKGKWKLIDNYFPENGKKKGNTRGNKMLFDLSKDPLETNNIYKQYPEIAMELEKEFNTIREAKSSRLLK
ncbi:iduronate-sulfatase or arylsulfatase A [Lentisphaera araneosa HTCC2155]|uniref:Iduronate-sulfatase or arylsulfatase A n=1 Tax=Lentisphaera araneosa HTCC2155 TaxID=313628 RepID=A6DIG7_9BACT|nr:arylsulfatase [Lentisphaera araneosa]EDM28821.1 iduronate-sulfatase or arylsulfatase A [Lentisphaera araneosa HTCC2155]